LKEIVMKVKSNVKAGIIRLHSAAFDKPAGSAGGINGLWPVLSPDATAAGIADKSTKMIYKALRSRCSGGLVVETRATKCA
jgi:hypothetical protein